MTIKISWKYIGIASVTVFVLTILLPIIIVKSIGKYQYQHTIETFEQYLTHPATLEKFPRTSIVDACKIEGECLENVALFMGRINEQSADHFIEFINKHPEVDMVCLNSGGGEVSDALRMSRLISERELATCMADYYKIGLDKTTTRGGICGSACNMLLLSSKTRIQQGVDLRFAGHSFARTDKATFSLLWLDWSIVDTFTEEPVDFEEVLNIADTPDKQKHLDYLSEVKDISHLDSMKILSNNELKKYRIFTQ